MNQTDCNNEEKVITCTCTQYKNQCVEMLPRPYSVTDVIKATSLTTTNDHNISGVEYRSLLITGLIMIMLLLSRVVKAHIASVPQA